MKKWQKIVVGFFAVIGAFYVALMLMINFSFISESSCSTYPVLVLPSPSGKFLAEQRQEICREDNKLTTRVWLSDGKSVNLGGRKWGVFHATSIQRSGDSNFEPLQLQFAWLGDSELQISYPRGIEMLSKGGGDYDVKVSYQERGR